LYVAQKEAFTAASDQMFRDLYCGVSTQSEVVASTAIKMKIAPNPARQECIIYTNGLRQAESFIVVNSMGQTVLQGRINRSAQRLDLSGLPSGNYWLRTESHKGYPFIIVN
jgi:hypothetical protein